MDSEQPVFWIEDTIHLDVRMITLWVLEQCLAVTRYITLVETLVADAQQVLMKASLGQLV